MGKSSLKNEEKFHILIFGVSNTAWHEIHINDKVQNRDTLEALCCNKHKGVRFYPYSIVSYGLLLKFWYFQCRVRAAVSHQLHKVQTCQESGNN